MTSHANRLTRLARLEDAHAPGAESVPVVLVHVDETAEQAAIRLGVDPTGRMVFLTIQDARRPHAPL